MTSGNGSMSNNTSSFLCYMLESTRMTTTYRGPQLLTGTTSMLALVERVYVVGILLL